ncbi:MAG: hypothetical protein ACKOE6_04135 [Flammeovirgaceae bacterium]
MLKTLEISSASQKIDVEIDLEPVAVELDPDTWLPFEGKIQKK